MPKSDAALMLFTSLSGEAELETEHIDLDKVNCSTGIQYLHIFAGYIEGTLATEDAISEAEAFGGLRAHPQVSE